MLIRTQCILYQMAQNDWCVNVIGLKIQAHMHVQILIFAQMARGSHLPSYSCCEWTVVSV